MNVPLTTDRRQAAPAVPLRGLVKSGTEVFPYRVISEPDLRAERSARPTLDRLSASCGTWREFEHALLRYASRRDCERPVVRFELEVSARDRRPSVSVLRTGPLDDGPWGVDVAFNLREGSATAVDAHRWGHALLAAAGLAARLNRDAGV